MWNACSPRIVRALLAEFALAAFALALSPAAGAAPLPDVKTLLARYIAAADDPGAPDVTKLETSGTVSGAGLSGTFHTWLDGDRERNDQTLGPQTESTLRIGERVWYADSDGDVRLFSGILARRERTQRFIDSGDFADSPERCALRGRVKIDGRAVYALDVTPDGGETETLYLDARTALPDKIAYDDDDGRTTITLSDWRTVSGHRFPFRAITSDGDHPFDTTQITTAVDLSPTIDPLVFAPLVPRRIDMAAPETIELSEHDGHLLAPVTIHGRSYTFLLDSGSQNVLLDTRVALELGLHPEGELEASGATRTGGLQLATVDEIDIGTGRLHDIVATTLDLGTSTQGAFRVDGILGYPFFAAATVRLDPAAKTITFGPPGSIAPAGEKVPLETDRALLEAQLRINGTEAPFIFDTGDAGNLLLYRPFVEKHPGIVPFSSTDRHSFGVGGEAESYGSALDELDIGNIPLYNVETDVMLATSGAFADRFDAGNVGLQMLDNFIVTFDVANGALYLERGPNFNDGRASN